MYDYHFSNFGRPPVPDDLCNDSAPRHPLFWRKRFLKVFIIYGDGSHLGSTDHDHFSNFSLPKPQEAPYEIWTKLAQRLQRRCRLKMLTDGRTDARTDDGHKVITIAHREHSLGELKKKRSVQDLSNDAHAMLLCVSFLLIFLKKAYVVGYWYSFAYVVCTPLNCLNLSTWQCVYRGMCSN